jgi:hypothetical protein
MYEKKLFWLKIDFFKFYGSERSDRGKFIAHIYRAAVKLESPCTYNVSFYIQHF